MSRIFLSYDSTNPACAGQIRQGLEAVGYTVWREPGFPTARDSSYPYLIENAILGSAAVVILWSQHAASSVWVKHHLLIAQRFAKVLVVVRLDALLALSEQAAHPHIRERKAAIEQAAEMLQRGEHREETLSILEYLARNDLIHSVQEKALSVFQTVTQQQQPASPPVSTPPQDARHYFAVRCKNGHVAAFDRREVCSQYTEVIRAPQNREMMCGLDELLLPCPECGVKMAIAVDCEGYA